MCYRNFANAEGKCRWAEPSVPIAALCQLCTVCGVLHWVLCGMSVSALLEFSIHIGRQLQHGSAGQAREANTRMRVAKRASILGFQESYNHQTTENLRRLFKSNQIIGDKIQWAKAILLPLPRQRHLRFLMVMTNELMSIPDKGFYFKLSKSLYPDRMEEIRQGWGKCLYLLC